MNLGANSFGMFHQEATADTHLGVYRQGGGVTTPARAAEGFTVRQAARADLLDVFRIEQASFSQPWPFAAFERFVSQPAFLVADPADGDGPEGAAIAGYVVADTVPNHGRPLGHVKDLAVHPEHRERGLGRLLLGEALTSMTIQGATLVKLEVREGNDPARSLYRDVGFESVRRIPRYYDDGEAALVMVLAVADWQRGSGEVRDGPDLPPEAPFRPDRDGGE